MLAAGSGSGSAEPAPKVVPTGGPPDIVGALSPSGRQAVAGAELLFSQRAFDAFVHRHPRVVGTLTRDRPYGSVSPADRGKIAWERTPAAERTAFADDFLSVWLGETRDFDADASETAPVPAWA